MARTWPLGFLGFLAAYGLPGALQGDWRQAIWLVWVVWFIHFLPVTGGETG